jgi:predicted peptidase
MNALKNHLILLLVVVGLIGCGGNNDDSSSVERTADDVKSDFQNLSIQPGINDLVLESTVSGIFWNFRIIAPEDASEINKRPLVLSLHGGAANIVPNAHKSTACMVEPAFEGLNAYILSPNSNGFFWYGQPNQVQVLALLDLAKTYLPIDETKVVITGYSDGGNGSWFYAQYYSDLFSAAIPMATSYDPEVSDGVVPKINIPLYVIHGENDELFPLAQTEEWVNQSKNAGSSIEFVVASGLNHYEFCDYVDYLTTARNWLQNEVWSQ